MSSNKNCVLICHIGARIERCDIGFFGSIRPCCNGILARFRLAATGFWQGFALLQSDNQRLPCSQIAAPLQQGRFSPFPPGMASLTSVAMEFWQGFALLQSDNLRLPSSQILSPLQQGPFLPFPVYVANFVLVATGFWQGFALLQSHNLHLPSSRFFTPLQQGHFSPFP